MSELLPGENLVLKTHQHWIVLVKALVIPVVVLIVAAVVDFTVKSGTGIPHFRTIVTLAAVAIALLWLIVVWIRWQSVAYTLTDQRIKIESGVFGRASKIIPIDRIQDCTTKQTLFGRMLGYGRVEVDAAGAQGAEVLDHLPQPGTFRDQVFVQSERRRGGAPSAPAPVNPSGV
ncbi:MAG TPA: PH domain-containing protein [Candidatus Nitrosopolaris sp.]|nr:PH domain-containing protein [Candidatus Nitrosopolaris sp.]